PTASPWQNPMANGSPESVLATATIQGVVLGTMPPGGYNFGLSEVVGGPPSDILNVTWQQVVFQDVNSTAFTFTFTSDVEGTTLQPPTTGTTPGNGIQLENGALQTFQVPGLTAISLTVGIQSDVETVPDGGATILMLSLALTGTAGWKRFLGR